MAKLVDPRQPRFGQGITGTVLLVGFVLGWPLVIPVVAAILAGASLGGPATNLYTWLFKGSKRVIGFDPPKELEEIGPPRFANTLGFVFLTTESILYFGFDLHVAAWSLGLLVSGLALLASITGLCVGCEFYVIARRFLTKGRVASKLVVPRERVGAGV
jgi:uncharacterized protein DUF4395